MLMGQACGLVLIDLDLEHMSVSALTGQANVREAKKLGFPDSRKMPILGIFLRDLGSGKVYNR